MKKLFIFAALLGLTIFGTVSAQQPLFSGCSSAGNFGHPVQFNCDYPGPVGNGVYLHYRGQSETTFNLSSMSLVGGPPFYDNTYQSTISFGANPVVCEYYFSSAQDTFIISQSPKNADNQFPPSSYKYANFIPDAQGDMVPGSDGNWLDLTNNGMSYSDTKFYCYIKNVSGSYPQSQFLTYYAYAMGFLITSGTDTTYYALVYANVPLMISSGLYKLNAVDFTYTRIGDISTNISSGILHMSCNLSAFAADPAWPGWPPPNGYIIPMGATLTASLTNQFENDITFPAIYQPQTQYLNFGTNNAPQLSSGHIDANFEVGITPKVTYSDLDNNLPTVRLFHFDSGSFEMNSSDHDYANSSEFETALGWPAPGWHHFYFEFSDGIDTVRTALDSVQYTPVQPTCQYAAGDANNSGTFTGQDVTYSVRFFKGGPPPPYSCECTPGHTWYVAGDVNGSCSFTGQDVTRMVLHFKNGTAAIACPDCPPARMLTPRPAPRIVAPSVELKQVPFWILLGKSKAGNIR